MLGMTPKHRAIWDLMLALEAPVLDAEYVLKLVEQVEQDIEKRKKQEEMDRRN